MIHVHTCIHTYVHACIHIYIYICINTYIHVYIHRFVRLEKEKKTRDYRWTLQEDIQLLVCCAVMLYISPRYYATLTIILPPSHSIPYFYSYFYLLSQLGYQVYADQWSLISSFFLPHRRRRELRLR